MTENFNRQAKAAGVGPDELTAIEFYLSENPLAGDVIPGTGGARKVRFSARSKGKSGGYRTIHFFGGLDVPIFLLALISKGQRSDLTQSERNELARLLPRIADGYRDGVRRKLRETTT